jgi:hypothetical protein
MGTECMLFRCKSATVMRNWKTQWSIQIAKTSYLCEIFPVETEFQSSPSSLGVIYDIKTISCNCTIRIYVSSVSLYEHVSKERNASPWEMERLLLFHYRHAQWNPESSCSRERKLHKILSTTPSSLDEIAEVTANYLRSGVGCVWPVYLALFLSNVHFVQGYRGLCRISWSF